MKSRDFNKCIINIIKGQGNIGLLLAQIKEYGTEEQYEQVISAIHRNVKHRKTLSALYMNRNINNIFSGTFIPSLTFSCGNSKENIYKDILFWVKFLTGYKNIISEFYNKKAQFEASYLCGNFQEAEQLLNDIYNTFGTSYWYIEMKLLLLNYSDYDSYRTFYESLKSLASNNLIESHIRLIKRRVNMRTSEYDYCDFFYKTFPPPKALPKPIEGYEYYRDYLNFMYTDSTAKLSELQLGRLSTVMYHLTLVDTVLLVERILLHLVCIHNISEYKHLYEQFQSTFIGNDVQRSRDYHLLKLLFCSGDYVICCNKCEELLEKHSDRFEIIDIYVKTLLILDRPSNLKNSPLSDVVSMLLNCYVKKDGTAFGTTFIDRSNQMLRSMSCFNGYYEFLNVISNTMLVKSTMEHPYWDIMVQKRPFNNSERDILNKKISSEGIISCDWSYSYYKKTTSLKIITRDAVSEKLKKIRDAKSTSIPLYQEYVGLDRIYFEEEIIVAFHQNIEKKQYLQAIQIYVQILIEDMLLVTRCDIERLSDELSEEKCIPLLSDLSFYIFAATTDLNRRFRDTPSQTLFDSLYEILTKYGFNVPSEFINAPFENKKLLYKFLEMCCDEKVLTQSPCDLYGKENLQEQIKILDYLYNSTHQTRYRSMLDKVKSDLAELKVRGMTEDEPLPNAKINTDWLSVEYDSDVLSAYDQLHAFSYEQISEDDNLFNLYKVMFIRCKEKYLIQVNKQLGTFIRHGVFVNRFVEFLKKYNLFFTSGDDQEDIERMSNNHYFLQIPNQNRYSVFNALQKNCLTFFQNLETIAAKIMFTSDPNDKSLTLVYIKSIDLRAKIRGIGISHDETEFIASIKKILDELIEECLTHMRKHVEANLSNAMNQYISSMLHDIPAQYYTLFPFDKLVHDFPEEISHIGEWFQVINDSTRKCDIGGYFEGRNVQYPDISFVYPSNTTIRRCDLILLDIIIENLIRNVESHSGFGCNHKDAGTEISITISQEEKYIRISAKNRLKDVDEENLQNKVNIINAIIPSLHSCICNADISGTHDSKRPNSPSLIHGVGLRNLGYVIYKACKTSCIHASHDSHSFSIEVSFGYGGCN